MACDIGELSDEICDLYWRVNVQKLGFVFFSSFLTELGFFGITFLLFLFVLTCVFKRKQLV